MELIVSAKMGKWREITNEECQQWFNVSDKWYRSFSFNSWTILN